MTCYLGFGSDDQTRLPNMSSNSSKQVEFFFTTDNVGEAFEPNFIGRSASFECGATIRISLHIDAAQRIVEAKFRAAGCSVMVAAASYLTSQIRGETTGDAASLAQRPLVINEQLGPIEPGREGCAALACEALLGAISEYSDSIREEWSGEEALICTCFGVSERIIENEIRLRSLSTIEDVTRACNAGAGCRSCYPLIQDILDDMQRQSS
ncbi:MAG TPA: iron-sulfur cluster assembly scaffold protein [Pyrinomonadaceae bacterium]|nr:iron-sulfur cluster assembly scaffold protein [Pyrinomonadaceae bacterium]